MPLIVLLLAAALATMIIIAFCTGIFRLERKTDKGKAGEQETTRDFSVGEEPRRQLQGQEEAQGTRADTVNLFDYFADEPDTNSESEDQSEASEDTGTSGQSQEAETVEEVEYDKMCNLKVGRGYLLDCQNALHQGVETGQIYAMLRIDVSRFRFINSLKGFSTGDYILTRLSQEIQDILPGGSFVTRLSADHFAALFPYADEIQLQDIHEQLRRAVERLRMDIGSKSALHICVGVVLTTSGIASSYDVFKLLLRANIARHCIKASRSDSYSMFDESMLDTWLYGESALEDYTEHQYSDDFVIYFRPQLSLTTERFTSCDTFVRWVHDDVNQNLANSKEPPSLPGSKAKVVYQTCRFMNRWRKSGIAILPVVVGLSELDLFRDDIDSFLLRCLHEFQLEPRMLIVSVDLHVIRIAPELIRQQLQKLREAEIKNVVSGFERGMIDSLEWLRGIPVDNIKLHKSFGSSISTSPERQQELSRIVAEADMMGIGVIAEGISTQADVDCLTGVGVDIVQGYYAGMPSRPDDFSRDLQGYLKYKGNKSSGGTVFVDDDDLARGNIKIY